MTLTLRRLHLRRGNVRARLDTKSVSIHVGSAAFDLAALSDRLSPPLKVVARADLWDASAGGYFSRCGDVTAFGVFTAYSYATDGDLPKIATSLRDGNRSPAAGADSTLQALLRRSWMWAGAASTL